jgi:hypothetical protein
MTENNNPTYKVLGAQSLGKGAFKEDEATTDLPLPKNIDPAIQRWRQVGPFLVALTKPHMHWTIVELQNDKRFSVIPEKLKGSWTNLSELERAIYALIGKEEKNANA